MTIATAPWISSAAHGVVQRGWMLPRNEKIRPSRAIAYGTRVLASKLPLSAPNTLVMMASMMTAPPAGPAIDVITVRAMARDGLIFPFLGSTHPRWATPWAALLIQGAVAIIMVLALKDYDALITYFVVIEWAALIFAVAAVFVLRRTMAGAPRPFRTPAYPLVPLLFVVGTVVGLSAIVWGQIQVHNFAPLYGLAIAAAGFPVHHLWKRMNRSPVT